MPSESPEGAAKSPQRSVSKMTNASGSRRFAVQICLDDFDENRTEPPLLTSPRSLLACGKQGVPGFGGICGGHGYREKHPSPRGASRRDARHLVRFEAGGR